MNNQTVKKQKKNKEPQVINGTIAKMLYGDQYMYLTKIGDLTESEEKLLSALHSGDLIQKTNRVCTFVFLAGVMINSFPTSEWDKQLTNMETIKNGIKILKRETRRILDDNVERDGEFYAGDSDSIDMKINNISDFSSNWKTVSNSYYEDNKEKYVYHYENTSFPVQKQTPFDIELNWPKPQNK